MAKKSRIEQRRKDELAATGLISRRNFLMLAIGTIAVTSVGGGLFYFTFREWGIDQEVGFDVQLSPKIQELTEKRQEAIIEAIKLYVQKYGYPHQQLKISLVDEAEFTPASGIADNEQVIEQASPGVISLGRQITSAEPKLVHDLVLHAMTHAAAPFDEALFNQPITLIEGSIATGTQGLALVVNDNGEKNYIRKVEEAAAEVLAYYADPNYTNNNPRYQNVYDLLLAYANRSGISATQIAELSKEPDGLVLLLALFFPNAFKPSFDPDFDPEFDSVDALNTLLSEFQKAWDDVSQEQ